MKKIHEVNVAMAGSECSTGNLLGAIAIIFADDQEDALACFIQLIISFINSFFGSEIDS